MPGPGVSPRLVNPRTNRVPGLGDVRKALHTPLFPRSLPHVLLPTVSQRIENELMLRVQAGDLEAFEQLVERYQNMVYGLALSIVRSPEDAEEAAQDAFVKLFRARHQFDASRELEPWLLCIAGNACRDRLRRRRTSALPLLGGEEGEDHVQQAPDRRAASDAQRTLQHTIRGELDRLSERARLPLELKYLRGMSNQQIADSLGISISSVKLQIARAKDILASRLERVMEA